MGLLLAETSTYHRGTVMPGNLDDTMLLILVSTQRVL